MKLDLFGQQMPVRIALNFNFYISHACLAFSGDDNSYLALCQMDLYFPGCENSKRIDVSDKVGSTNAISIGPSHKIGNTNANGINPFQKIGRTNVVGILSSEKAEGGRAVCIHAPHKIGKANVNDMDVS